MFDAAKDASNQAEHGVSLALAEAVFAGPCLTVTDDRFAYGELQHIGPDVALHPAPYTAILCDGGAFHYFHLMESVAWLWAIQHEFLGGRPPIRIVLSIAWDDPRQCGIGRMLMAALYPGIELLDPNAAGWPRRLNHVPIVHRSWAQMRVKRPGCLVVELFPPSMRAYDYQFTAELFGLSYAGFEGDRIFAAGDRTPQYGDLATSNSPVLRLDVARIARLISASLERSS